MNPTTRLYRAGQSLCWTTSIGGRRERELPAVHRQSLVTGLTSNPTISTRPSAKRCLRPSHPGARFGLSSEDIFFGLAIDDLQQAAASSRLSSRKISRGPRLRVARGLPTAGRRHRGHRGSGQRLHAQAQRPNLFIKIPGTPANRPSRRPPSRVCRSMSRCSSRSITTLLRPTRTCVVWNAASRLTSTPTLLRWPRSSSAGGTSPSPTMSPRTAAIASVLPSATTPTAHTASFSTAIAGNDWPTMARVRSDCCMRAPGPRIPPHRTPCTYPASRRPTRSTPCLKQRCLPSPTTARCRRCCRVTVVTRPKCWRASGPRGSTSTRLGNDSSAKEPGVREFLARPHGSDLRPRGLTSQELPLGASCRRAIATSRST